MPTRLARFVGEFHAVRRADQVQAWIGNRPGWNLWPEGWAVRFDPLELVDPDGAVIAMEGEQLHAAGGLISDALALDRFGLDESDGRHGCHSYTRVRRFQPEPDPTR
jgi:hypothetical protein